MFRRYNCHAAEKSEAIATCKEMPVMPFNKEVDKKKNVKGGQGDQIGQVFAYWVTVYFG
jgi:hypothetical protein